MKLSGNHSDWLSTVAKEIREAGSPVSLDFLRRVVPNQFVTAQNDGHVTAAENGLDRDDYVAGWRIWIDETLKALTKKGLVVENAEGFRWNAPQDGAWKVKLGRSSYTIYGRAEKAAGRDRHMLGEDGSPGYLLKGWSEAEVDVEVGAGKEITKGRHMFKVHPLAFVIPPMTPAEQEQVRADIAAHGVKMPLVLYRDADDKTVRGKAKWKVLDGRHRLQFASALGKPVRVELFEGTDQEARQYVASLNLHRRQLTRQQRELAVERLFGDPARAEADAAKRAGVGRPKIGEKFLSNSNGRSERKKSYERAWEMAGGKASGVSKAGVKAAATIAQAPKVAARVEAGEIRSTDTALREARAEIAGTDVEPRKVGGAVSAEMTETELIGKALYMLRRAAQTDNPGRATPEERDERLTEIIRLAEKLLVNVA